MAPDGGEFTCPASRLHWRRVLSCQSRTPHAESRIHRRRRPSRPRSHAHDTTPEGRRNVVGVCEIEPECLRWATEASPYGRIYDDHWEMLEREDLDIVYCVIMHERCAGCSLVTRHVGGGRSYRTAERPRRVPQPFSPRVTSDVDAVNRLVAEDVRYLRALMHGTAQKRNQPAGQGYSASS